MISVAEALEACFALVEPLAAERVPLLRASGRVLAADAVALRNQPPFAASAMDGYAIRFSDLLPGASFEVVGEAAAGHLWHGRIETGQALRIFTGAPLPDGADHVVIQEDVTRQGDHITLTAPPDPKSHIRPEGVDFAVGDCLAAPRRLSPADIALAAAMNLPQLEVTRRPIVALIATGDELVQPGETPRPDQIIASNSYGLKAMLEAEGAETRLLPIARDSEESLRFVLDLAKGADFIVTIGGASVGDHDLVGQVAGAMGLERAFYKVAMRPGKPLMAGRLGKSVLLGLPGNPVSSLVCGQVFLLPMIRAALGLGKSPAQRETAELACAIAQNGPREHYMRSELGVGGVMPFEAQDSALLSVLSQSNCLLVRPAHDPARAAGEPVDIIRL